MYNLITQRGKGVKAAVARRRHKSCCGSQTTPSYSCSKYSLWYPTEQVIFKSCWGDYF